MKNDKVHLNGELSAEQRGLQEAAINESFRKHLPLDPSTVEVKNRRYRPRAERLHAAQIQCQGRQRSK